MTHATPSESVMMQVPDVGAFVRVLLEVRLTGGHTVTYGLWLAVDPADLAPTFATWWEPEYASLRLQGRIANSVPPWGLLRSPVETEVRDIDQTPYCRSSTDPTLHEVLNAEWDHDLVLGAIGLQ